MQRTRFSHQFNLLFSVEITEAFLLTEILAGHQDLFKQNFQQIVYSTMHGLSGLSGFKAYRVQRDHSHNFCALDDHILKLLLDQLLALNESMMNICALVIGEINGQLSHVIFTNEPAHNLSAFECWQLKIKKKEILLVCFEWTCTKRKKPLSHS